VKATVVPLAAGMPQLTSWYSPTLPAAAWSAATVPVEMSVVNVPAAGVVAPMTVPSIVPPVSATEAGL
jgi:hypothetical protein